MSAQNQPKGVIPFPPKKVGRRRKLGDPHYCPVCEFPSATKRGVAAHYRACHTDNELADRNWEILYFHLEHGHSVVKLAYEHKLSVASIYRIIFRGLAFPGIYELDLED